MKQSGYVMIDCTGLDLGNPSTVTGLYKQLDAAIKSGKLVLLENVVNGTTKFSPIPAFAGVEDAGIFASFVPVTIHVTSQDVVTI